MMLTGLMPDRLTDRQTHRQTGRHAGSLVMN